MKIIITDNVTVDRGCSGHGPILGDLGGTDSGPHCCSVKQSGYDDYILPRGKMTGGVDIPHGSLPADGDTGAHLLFHHGGVIPKGGPVPASQSKSQATGNRTPFSLLQRMEEANVSSGSRWGCATHHHPPACSAPLPLQQHNRVHLPLS